MTRSELINKLRENFNIKELVCPHCYEKFGEKSWQFLSTELLSILYTLRYEIFKAPITVNTWHNRGNFSQRGLRCNVCELVKSKKSIHLSAHCLGKAIDFNVKNLDSKEVAQMIRLHKDEFQYPIRLEKNTSGWTHIDVYEPIDSKDRLIEFNG